MRHRRAIATRWIHVGWPVGVVAFTAVYVGMPGLVGDSFFLVGSLLPIGAIAIGMRIYPVPYKLPWQLAAAAIALMSVPNLAWIIQVDIQGQQSPHPLAYLALACGHLTMLAASITIVVRHAPTDPGGVLHAALLGLGLSAPVWQAILRPTLLANGVPALRQAALLIMVLALMTLLGTLLRVMATTVRARPTFYYLLVGMSGGMAAVILTTLASGPERTTMTLLAEAVWFIGYFSCAAAVLHPSVVHLTAPEGDYPDDLSTRRLASTAVVLSMPASTAGATLAVGGTPDVLLLIVSTLISIPLMLIRFWQLALRRLRAEQALAHQASHDELTGLPNRRTLLEKVDEALRQLRSGSVKAVAVLFCDLDGFKPINDTLGHQAGDEVLRVVAQRLRGCAASSDVVGRFGGDEFLIVCRDDGGGSVDALVERIRRALAEPIQVREKTCTVGASIGVAVTTDGSASSDSLISEADQAMYALKQSTRATRSRK